MRVLRNARRREMGILQGIGVVGAVLYAVLLLRWVHAVEVLIHG